MSQNAKKGAQLIREIANGGKRGLRFPIMSGVVVAGSVDVENGVCSVILDVNDDSVATGGVTLNTVILNQNGMLLIPADNSHVLVAEVNGPSMLTLIKCSNLLNVKILMGNTRVSVTDGEVSVDINGSHLTVNDKLSYSNGSGSLKTVMDNILTHIQALTVSTGTGPSSVPVNVADFAADQSDLDNLLN